ncbi:Intraflagellar transport protein 22 [Clonorchis sinensis]|uniref:Intraflagellar transport protein 22 n=1 Tax=Clonorchis sinensis TaxID=79923 RepID=A0A8T1M9G3_CLOSI|nr:Intraflagellar transport protein 22 [Clonorchis sinensis]
MNRIKVVVVGPSDCGKSYLCNFLSEAIEQVTGDYRPTVGVRIIEYEVNVSVKTKPVKVEVELWDLSGDVKYENCWPAVFKGSHGVMFVYSPDHSEHSRELEDWHTRTHRTFPLKDTCCCVVSNNKCAKVERDVVVLPLAFSKFKHIKNNIADDGEKLREQFGKFITQILSSRQEATEQEELNIMNA